jgi:hypothetical protein
MIFFAMLSEQAQMMMLQGVNALFNLAHGCICDRKQCSAPGTEGCR